MNGLRARVTAASVAIASICAVRTSSSPLPEFYLIPLPRSRRALLLSLRITPELLPAIALLLILDARVSHPRGQAKTADIHLRRGMAVCIPVL